MLCPSDTHTPFDFASIGNSQEIVIFSKSSNIVNEQTILYRTRSFQKGQRIKAVTHGRKRNLSSVKKLLLHRKPFFVPVGVQNKLFLISVAGPFLSIIQVLRHSGIMYLGVRLAPS